MHVHPRMLSEIEPVGVNMYGSLEKLVRAKIITERCTPNIPNDGGPRTPTVDVPATQLPTHFEGGGCYVRFAASNARNRVHYKHITTKDTHQNIGSRFSGYVSSVMERNTDGNP